MHINASIFEYHIRTNNIKNNLNCNKIIWEVLKKKKNCNIEYYNFINCISSITKFPVK